ncbi:hypothetical protein MNBD_ALPHA12-1171 [hydrothermal vent metagenome]|uniref:TolA protein n=1 Tax=hydrothermal vent metagenome TaxID=652676 RepID=A0A3B0TUV7_9ZZZZ
MRVGLPVSVFSHSALVLVGLISLGNAPLKEPRQIEAISVDIIPITEFSNIRAGALDSKILDTQTPSIVDTPVPAQLAQPTGNTKENQAMPLATDKVTPAPTEQTAPEPSPAPSPNPTPEPKPAAVKTPIPEPTPKPAPTEAKPAAQPAPTQKIIASETKATPDPVEPAPKPVMRTASLDQKRAEYARRKREQATRPADKVSDIINAEKSRGATTGTGGKTTLGTRAGQSATLTRSEQDALATQMRQCWSLLPGEIDSGLSVRLLVNLNQDGTVVGIPRVISNITSDMLGSISRAAQRAVLECGPYRLAAEKYAQWKQIDVTFRASDKG